MKAPHYMRADLIGTILNAAVYQTSDLIEKIEIHRRDAIVTTETETLTFNYSLGHSVDEHGYPLLGSDSWSAWLAHRSPRSGSKPAISWWRHLFSGRAEKAST